MSPAVKHSSPPPAWRQISETLPTTHTDYTVSCGCHTHDRRWCRENGREVDAWWSSLWLPLVYDVIKKTSTCCRSRIPCVVVKIWHVDVKTAASSWKKITVHEPLLGASITVRLWSFTRILDLSRIYCAAKRRSPPGSINGHGWNWWGWCGVYIPGAGVAGILNTYTHGVVRWWRLSITSKKPVSANGL